jgi:hypothetical protein
VKFQLSILLVAGVCGNCATAFALNAEQLAKELSFPGTRERAVEEILQSKEEGLRLLQSWTRRPPSGVDLNGLHFGMAVAFGRMHAPQAIPFLIKNISVQQFPSQPNVWMKSPEVIESRLPAVTALIGIGPEAARALIRQWDTIRSDDERLLAAVFVLARVDGVPEAKEILATEAGRANMIHFWAEDGLRRSEGRN